MRKLFLFKTLALAFFLLAEVGSAWGQIISQYVDTDSGTTPKGIEIWNNTEATLNFSVNNLVIEKGTNGGAPSTDFTISSGTLASGAVIVIGTSDMEATAIGNDATFYEKAFTYSGNDALVVKYGGTIIDMLGTSGIDPGIAWSGNDVSTDGQNIQLQNTISLGDSDGWSDPSTRFETISSAPAKIGGLFGFGIAPTTDKRIMTNTTSISNLDYIVGYGPSFDQAFALAGVNLTGDLVITAPENFEISLSGAENFSGQNPIHLTQTNGIVQSKIIYVRLKEALDKNSYSGDISLTSTEAETSTISLSGEVSDLPGLPYIQDFETFTNIAYLPDAWHVTDTKYEGDWGGGSSEGLRGNQNVLGYQNISSSDFTATLTLKNNSGNTINELFIIYEGMAARMDQGRSPKWTVKINGNEIPSLNYSTELNSDTYHSAYISGLNILSNSTYTISWSTVNGEGTGSNKQIGISNISVLSRADLTELNDGSVGSINGETNSFVNSDYTLDANLVFKNLFVLGTAKLYMPMNFNLTLNGALYVGQNASLTLKSDINNTASLIVKGAVTGDVIAERYLTEYDLQTDSKYHFISSPVSNQAIQPEFVANSPATDEDFYKFDETENSWINTKTAGGDWNSAFGNDFEVGKGYLVAYPAIETKQFSGTLNNDASYTFNCSYTDGKGNGWNLIGNPYPAAIDWTGVTLGDGMDDALYYYDAANQKYISYLRIPGDVTVELGGSQYIPSMQGFMVHATNTGTKTVTIEKADLTHSGQSTFYKSTENIVSGSMQLKLSNDDFSDEAYIYFNENATESFDGSYDAYKLMSANYNVPMIYTTINNGDQLSINGLPQVEEGTTIPVSLRIGEDGLYTIQATIIDIETNLFLEDLVTGVSTKLNENSTYSFTASEGDSPDRFLLHFGAVGIGEQDQASTLNAYVYNNSLYVNNSLEKAQLAIYDLQGRLVVQQAINEAGLQSLPLNLQAGIYVLQLSNTQQAQSVKINIQ